MPNTDAELYAANSVCNEQFGSPQRGIPTSSAYKRCMANRGWKFVTTKHDVLILKIRTTKHHFLHTPGIIAKGMVIC